MGFSRDWPAARWSGDQRPTGGRWNLRRGGARSLGALLAALAGAGCGAAPEPVPPHVIVVLADTLRADHLGAWGYPRATSPSLDAFAAKALLFEEATSQAPCTYPSANSLLTGRHPAAFLFQGEGRMGIPETVPTLASILGAEGYATIAVSASPIVRRSPSNHNPNGGFDAGFEVFDESCLWNRGACVNARLAPLLEAQSGERPLFLYLHYMDPHDPYSLPADHEYRFAGSYEGELEAVRQGRPGLIRKQRRDGEEVTLSRSDLRHLVDLYDERIRYFDDQFAALLQLLQRRRLLDHAIVAFVSDHGEQFMEHGQLAHCNSLFQEELHVPMILSLPGVSSGRRSRIVRNLELAPTLLDYAGISRDGLELDGASLRPLIETREPVTDLAMSLWGAARSARGERYKLIFDIASRRGDFFDLKSNPRELAPGVPIPADERLELVMALAESVERRERSARGAALAGKQAIERLRALGYIQ